MVSQRSTGRRHAVTGFALAAFVVGSAVAVPVGAQPSGGEGFLFKEPVVSFSVRGGFAHAQAGGQLLEETRRALTIDRSDFNSSTYAADLAFRVTSRIDFAIGASIARSSTPSEFREWLDNEDEPIEQTTDFDRIPLTASVKVYLTPRGRAIGQFAWVPARFAPYVGAGAGQTWYRFRQVGDFVDDPFEVAGEHTVFSDRFESKGWTPTGHAMAGIDMTLSNHVGLTAEARYGYAKAKLGRDFSGYDRIDLSGATATVGMFFRF